jgi:hypothetical protein
MHSPRVDWFLKVRQNTPKDSDAGTLEDVQTFIQYSLKLCLQRLRGALSFKLLLETFTIAETFAIFVVGYRRGLTYVPRLCKSHDRPRVATS